MTAETKLIKARTGDEMLAALAEGMGGGDAPTLEELAAWWPDCPDADRKEANKRLAALFVGRFRMTTDPPFVAESAQWSSTAAAVNVVMVQAHPVEDLSSVTIDNSNGDSVELLPDLAAPVEIRRRLTLTAFPVVHRVWRAEARAAVRVARSTDATPPKAPHPLAPIVRAWAAQPTAVAPYPVRRRASLPNPTRDPGPLPDFASRDAPDPPSKRRSSTIFRAPPTPQHRTGFSLSTNDRAAQSPKVDGSRWRSRWSSGQWCACPSSAGQATGTSSGSPIGSSTRGWRARRGCPGRRRWSGGFGRTAGATAIGMRTRSGQHCGRRTDSSGGTISPAWATS